MPARPRSKDVAPPATPAVQPTGYSWPQLTAIVAVASIIAFAIGMLATKSYSNAPSAVPAASTTSPNIRASGEPSAQTSCPICQTCEGSSSGSSSTVLISSSGSSRKISTGDGWMQAWLQARADGKCKYGAANAKLVDNKRVKLSSAQTPSCAVEQDGVLCIPTGCDEAGGKTKDPDSPVGESSPPGAEQFPSWVSIPSCDVVKKCPDMVGWPSDLASLCRGETIMSHCLEQLPPPAKQSELPREVRSEYIPSKFEVEYMDKVKRDYNDQPDRACLVQDQYPDLVMKWVKEAEGSWVSKDQSVHNVAESDLEGWASKAEEPFSVFKTTVKTAGGETITSGRRIEPMAGLMRHPFAANLGGQAFCSKTDGSGRSIYDWRYIIVEAMSDPTFKARYPGRKIFVDLGATTWGDRPKDEPFHADIADARTYADIFRTSGIVFDLMLGWEAKQNEFGHDRFFTPVAKYDSSILSKMCYALRPAQPVSGHLDNALEMVAQIWRPGDFFVFKLDIDNRPVEEAFISIVLDKCPHIVAELIYEQHCWVPEVTGCCWGDTPDTHSIKYGESLRRFQQLRKMGIRSHYWV